MASSKFITIIAGVGPGTGSSIARKFAKSYPVVLLARKEESYKAIESEINSSGGKAVGISADVSSQDSVKNAVSAIHKEFGSDVAAAAAIYNVSGGFVRKPFLELGIEAFDDTYNINIKGPVLFSQAVLPLLLRGVRDNAPPFPPTLIFTGATASVRGSALFASLAAGKFAGRAISQSLAREFGPQGVHVAHVVVDGVIDVPLTESWLKDAGPDAKLNANAMAETFWHLHTQHRSAFTLELDVRPFAERF